MSKNISENILEQIRHLTTEEKVLYATECVRLYCQRFCISHEQIDALLEHMAAILSMDLIEWDDQFDYLEFSGDLEPLPPALNTIIPVHLQEEFQKLVLYATDVGRRDMYGAKSEHPFKHILIIIDILQNHHIKLPSPRLFRSNRGTSFPG